MTGAQNSRAVFLSYASQDSAAANRICAALRAAGVEVWFDQSELVGGDAWDAKIRGQVQSCALFVAVISANTQARLEGYFRLEWKLAALRTHTMADAKPFLLPVVIDDTRDSDAHVPGEFKAVQWTRLPNGDPSEKFCARVRHLLDGEVAETSSHALGPIGGRSPTGPGKGRRGPVLGALLLVALLVAGAICIPRLSQPASRPSPQSPQPPVATAPAAKAQQLTAQARTLYEEWDLATPDELKLAERLAKAATELDPFDADGWATLALASYALRAFHVDVINERTAQMRTAAERAVKLAPRSDLAKLALAETFRVAEPTRDEALRLLRELATEHPSDKFILRQLGSALRNSGRSDEALECYDRAAALPGGDPVAVYLRGVALAGQERFAEAEAAFDRALAMRPDFAHANQNKLALLLQRGDLQAAIDLVQSWPARLLLNEDLAASASATWYFGGDFERSSRALANVSADYVESPFFTGPKAYVAGEIDQAAGRTAAAAIEWQSALHLTEQRLAQNPASLPDLGNKAALLAFLGQRTAAEETLRAYEQLSKLPSGRVTSNTLEAYAALGRADAIADYFTREFASEPPRRRLSAAADYRFERVLDPFRQSARFAALTAEADRVIADAAKEKGRESGAGAGATRPAQAPEKSVAVLAFADQSAAHDSEYFSDGISEELINALGKVPGLKVSARTSSFYFKGKSVPVPEIAQQLGVAFVIEGSVQRAGEKVKISARLTQAADGFQVWSDSLTRDAKDVFAVEEEIAGLVVANLSLKLGAVSAPQPTVNPHAVELYLRARQAWNLRTMAGYADAEDLLNEVLVLEPGFARAHAALADVWNLRGQNQETITTLLSRDGELARAIVAEAKRALTLDPQLAEGYASLGGAYWTGWRLAESEHELREAIRLNPNYATAHQWLGRTLMSQGRLEEALAELRLATEVDPLSSRILDNYAWALLNAGRATEALHLAERALVLQPTSGQARGEKALALALLGRADEAAAEALQLDLSNAGVSTFRELALGMAGRTAEATAPLSRFAGGSLISRVAGLAAVRRYEEALAALDPNYISSARVDFMLFQPVFDPMRNDPRFAQALAALGLTEAEARAQAWRTAHPAK